MIPHATRSATRARFSLCALPVALGLLAVIAACPRPAPLEACAKDTDCKGARICERGICIEPSPSSAARATRSGLPDGGLSASPRDAGPDLPVAAAQWMYRGGPAHHGRADEAAPLRTPKLVWKLEAQGVFYGGAALAQDGTVYVGSHDHLLYAVANDGTVKWKFQTKDLIFSTPAIGRDGTVYAGSDDDRLYALSPAGQPLWAVRIGTCREDVGIGPESSRCDADAGPTIGPDGTLYTGGDGIYAIRGDGSLKWRFALSQHVASAPALGPDGTVYAGCQDDALYALAPDGTKRWEFRTGDDIDGAPMVMDDGTVVFGSDDHKVYALTPTGIQRWAVVTRGAVHAPPALGRDGTIYAASFDGGLYAISPDGSVLWVFRASDKIASPPLVAGDGAILFGAQDDRVYCIEKDGKLRWTLEIGADVDAPITLGADGTLYIGADDKVLRAFR